MEIYESHGPSNFAIIIAFKGLRKLGRELELIMYSCPAQSTKERLKDEWIQLQMIFLDDDAKRVQYFNNLLMMVRISFSYYLDTHSLTFEIMY